MADDFIYDVFLSHSAKDTTVVRALAERLESDKLRVWFYEWKIEAGDIIEAKIEEGLEYSRVLVLCLSANAFGSEWAQLEAGTFRFRDPLNKNRRFIPLRLDDAPIKGSLTQSPYINYLSEDRDQEYAKLFEACRKPETATTYRVPEQVAEESIQLGPCDQVCVYAFTGDGKHVLAGGADSTILLCDVGKSQSRRVLKGHTKSVWSIAWSTNQRRALSGSEDNTIRMWEIDSGRCLKVFRGHTKGVCSVAWGGQDHALSGADDNTVRLWNLENGFSLGVLEGHSAPVKSLIWSEDLRLALSGSCDTTVRVWNMKTGRCEHVLEGHTNCVTSIVLSVDRRRALSGSSDRTMRLWDLETGRCLRVLTGHTGAIRSVAWGADQSRALSAGEDNEVRLWDLETGRCLQMLAGHQSAVITVAGRDDQRRAYSGDTSGVIRVWDTSGLLTEPSLPKAYRRGARTAQSFAPSRDQVQYTNAKVLLVGETGAGKTGLSKRLALNEWQASDSTVGAWATQWKLPVSLDDGIEREIWLWDFGGQADQRLIHQLYMDETALALLVFDGQKEDLFETLGQWDRDLTRASSKPFTKLLVAGRVDAGGLRVSRRQVEAFAKERGYRRFLETSAKVNLNCQELREAILEGIPWENIPWRSSPILFMRLKEEIVRLKDEGRVLMRFNELRETLQLRLMEEKPGQVRSFNDEELKAVVTLLAGPAVVWELKFGGWVLLQPERINAYAQAVIQTMREDEHERGCLSEEQVLSGNLKYHSSLGRLGADEERFVLLAMHQILVERGLCLREHTDRGPLLIFPSYYRRERLELVGHPAVLVSYHFSGFLDDIYTTLVVRLHHTKPFQQDKLWRYAADFKTLTGKQLGIKLTRQAEGVGELEVYFDPTIPLEEKIIFSKYVHEHLLQSARDVVRLRHYVCRHCGTTVGNRDVAMKRLNEWLRNRPPEPQTVAWFKLWRSKQETPTIVCSECEKRVPLWDELEQCFASPETQQRVTDMQEQSTIVLDNQSKERALVGEVISTVALAAQLCREFNVSDQGIDMEIEFKSDDGKATGRKLYLQLKSGDSYLYQRTSDGAEIFRIKDERHARYWMAQAFPVLLVIRNSEGEVRWMEIRDYLKGESDSGKSPVRQIIFNGERLDVMSVRRWRERELRQGLL